MRRLGGYLPFICLVVTLGGAQSSDCDRNGPQCLDVFTHSPATLPKCYCTSVCQGRLTDLVRTCASGQLHADGCGTCLTCARAQGQSCGGRHNILGVCASGLACLIRFNQNAADPRFEEQTSSGTCVDVDSNRCPHSTDRTQKKGVNCRPGRVGILAEALYCPVLQQASRQPTQQQQQQQNNQQQQNQQQRPVSAGPPRRPIPSILQLIQGK